jgi:hypothetical protein
MVDPNYSKLFSYEYVVGDWILYFFRIFFTIFLDRKIVDLINMSRPKVVIFKSSKK